VSIDGFDFGDLSWAAFLDVVGSNVDTSCRDLYTATSNYWHGIANPAAPSRDMLIKILCALWMQESTLSHFGPLAFDQSWVNNNGYGAVWPSCSLTLPPPPTQAQGALRPLVGYPAGIGVGQVDPPQIPQIFDWRSNVARAIQIFRRGAGGSADDLSDTLSDAEQDRLAQTPPPNAPNVIDTTVDAMTSTIISTAEYFVRTLVLKYNGHASPYRTHWQYHVGVNNQPGSWTVDADSAAVDGGHTVFPHYYDHDTKVMAYYGKIKNNAAFTAASYQTVGNLRRAMT
jgi:hypothetical protein